MLVFQIVCWTIHRGRSRGGRGTGDEGIAGHRAEGKDRCQLAGSVGVAEGCDVRRVRRSRCVAHARARDPRHLGTGRRSRHVPAAHSVDRLRRVLGASGRHSSVQGVPGGGRSAQRIRRGRLPDRHWFRAGERRLEDLLSDDRQRV